ncbi:hypothetical protein EYY60_09225 [Flavobacterium zhairuonense]|uniref:hypothetical protein n=1 Tax=Flavobacterium zhairuonense TaxID=2493631 RepID=UPI00104F1357|nr:hypothetical protein [Flavobacterium zhairuonense]KAF2510685.1 hypothetical protein EYY60_09225 [Flavobacterium zhairuonense]
MRKILLLFFLFVLASCDKDPVLIQSGIETKVNGKITDDHDVPISNLIVKVGEYKVTTTGSYLVSYEDHEFIKWVDSTFTDNNGNYDFVFKTTGKGNFYQLSFGKEAKDKEPQVLWRPFTVNITEDANDLKYIGKQFEFNSKNLILLYPCEVTFKVNNVTTFPTGPSHNLTYTTYNITANGESKQTLYIDKYNKQIVDFYRTKNGVLQKASYEFPASNVEDTTYQTITVEETDFKNVN